MANDEKHRLTIRIPQSMRESLQSMSKHTGLPMTELVVSGTLLLLGHEEAMRVYENRVDDFLDKASERFDLLLTEHKAVVDELMEKMANGIEADRSVIEYFKSVLDEHVKNISGANNRRGPIGPGSRISPTGAPILD